MQGYKRPRKDTTAKVLYLRPRLYRGVYSRVARELGVSRSTVRQVGIGQKTSRRINAALVRAAARIEREIEKLVGENVA